MKPFLSITVTLIMLSVTAVKAQLILSSTTYAQNFDTIGTNAAAALPAGWGILTYPNDGTTTDYASLDKATRYAYGSSGTGAVTASSGGGAINWANGDTATSTERPSDS